MSKESYIKLREFLDTFPIGFPKSANGIEIKILKKSFTKQEAEIAIHLTAIPEKISRIARRAGFRKEDLEPILYEMSKKGLIFRIERNGKILFNAAPFMIGIYEYSVKKIDKELATLYKEYYDHVFMDELASSNVPGFKVIPVEKTIEENTTLYPYHKLEDSIKNARKIAVTDCICRKEARLTGEGCDYPIETCLSFGVAAEYYIENRLGRAISAKEAIEIIKKADEAGLVHAGANSKHLSNICNCCPCCCASMKGITKKGFDKHRFLNAIFESVIDKDLCIACGACIERCPVNAITLKEYAEVDRDNCLGCGLCAGICPEEAINMHLREDGEEPFDRILELGKAIYQGKQNNLL